jgi:thioredoxin-like negative regulator of GroEL
MSIWLFCIFIQILSRKYFKTRFVQIDVDHAPFLVQKLKIQVLPCVIMFLEGIAIDQLFALIQITRF